jgi:VanZ family protein
MRKFLKDCLLIVLWMGVIFFLSHHPDLRSGLEDWLDFVLRKIAHITEYAILTLLLIRAIKLHLNKKGTLVVSALIALVYAISDEYHQTFVFGRHGTVRDVGIDSIGIILMTLLVLRFWKIFPDVSKKALPMSSDSAQSSSSLKDS